MLEVRAKPVLDKLVIVCKARGHQVHHPAMSHKIVFAVQPLMVNVH